MKRMMTWISGVGAMLLLSSAACGAGYSATVTIVDMEVIDNTGTSRVYLSFSATPHTVGCTTSGAGQWRIGGSAENVKNLIAVAMAARLADRPVKVYFLDTYSGTSSCDQGGTSGYPVILGMLMQ
jgi:hypothetical protein